MVSGDHAEDLGATCDRLGYIQPDSPPGRAATDRPVGCRICDIRLVGRINHGAKTRASRGTRLMLGSFLSENVTNDDAGLIGDRALPVEHALAPC